MEEQLPYPWLRMKLKEKVAADLSGDVFAFHLKTKNFHRHTRGRHFHDYRLRRDDQADQIFVMTDVTAERARKIGATTLHFSSDIGKDQRLRDNNQGSVIPLAMLSEVCTDNRELTGFLRLTDEVCER
jgi:starvation-inducible DNA-binding protein